MSERAPYTGITGFTKPQESQVTLQRFKEHGGETLPFNRQLMVGVLVSQFTLNHKPAINAAYPAHAYPAIDDVPQILKAAQSPKVFSVIHYDTPDMTTLADQVEQVFRVGNMYNDNICRGLQLNLVNPQSDNLWPPKDQLVEIKKKLPDMRIIFEVTNELLQSGTPQQTAGKMKDYQQSIDYILLDPSGGQGKEFSFDSIKPYYDTLSKELPEVMIGFAGGFSAENVEERSEEIAQKIGTRRFSIDAQSRLRDADYHMDLQKVDAYLQKASIVFAKE